MYPYLFSWGELFLIVFCHLVIRERKSSSTPVVMREIKTRVIMKSKNSGYRKQDVNSATVKAWSGQKKKG